VLYPGLPLSLKTTSLLIITGKGGTFAVNNDTPGYPERCETGLWNFSRKNMCVNSNKLERGWGRPASFARKLNPS